MRLLTAIVVYYHLTMGFYMCRGRPRSVLPVSQIMQKQIGDIWWHYHHPLCRDVALQDKWMQVGPISESGLRPHSLSLSHNKYSHIV
jgi:hypothetical protein